MTLLERNTTASSRRRGAQPPAPASCAAATSRGSAARAPTSASCSRPGSRCRRASRSRPRRSRRSSTRRGCRSGSRRRWPRVSPGDVDAIGAASHAISEAMRFAPVPDVGARRGRAALRGARGRQPAWTRRRSRCARARSARTARTRRSPASRRPICGCAGSSTCATPCATAGSASTARRRSATARGSATRAAPPAMGVTVQLMVDAEVSGVMFTCNPVSGDPSMVAINASWGLGLAVVGGEVTPDDYLVSKVTGEVVREHVHAKQVEYVPDAGGRGAVRASVPDERRDAPLPRPAGARRRSSTWRGAVERHFGSPPGHRVGDRSRRRARAVRRAVAAGDGGRQDARASPGADVGDRRS